MNDSKGIISLVVITSNYNKRLFSFFEKENHIHSIRMNNETKINSPDQFFIERNKSYAFWFSEDFQIIRNKFGL